MLRNISVILCAALLLGAAGCGREEKENMQTQLDSLKNALEMSQQVAKTLEEVGGLMDSIDANRQLLRVNMVEGTTYDDYSARMKDINNYVKDTQRKIDDLEAALRKSKGVSASYAATIKRLKNDIETKNAEIAQLQEQVENFRTENSSLVTTVGLQAREIAEQESEINAKRQELALIEARIQELMVLGKMNEADQYFARAQAVEEAANRTKLAPKKKKETLKEALELYRKSYSSGKQEAQGKISELEKKIE